MLPAFVLPSRGPSVFRSSTATEDGWSVVPFLLSIFPISALLSWPKTCSILSKIMHRSVRDGSDTPPAPALRLGVSPALASGSWRSGLSRIRVGIRSPHNLNLPSPICRLRSAICDLPSAICHLRSSICHLPSAICHLPSVLCPLPSAISHPWLRLRPCSLALSALLFAFFFLPLAQAADFYMATNGSDLNSGAIDQPFATLQKARDAGRALGKTVQKRIILRGGSYYDVALWLDGWSDGNITIMPYPGENPILYGGQPLTNWTDIGSGCFSVTLPTFPTNVTSSVSQLTSWQPRMLLADGVMCPRARLPATGKFHYQSLSGTNLTYTNTFPATTNMEVIVDNSWNDAEMSVTAINTSAKTLTLNGAVARGPNTGDVTSFALVNLPEGMTQDNQFWWNKTNNTVVYRPPVGKDPNTMSIIVPTTTRIFFLKGTWTGGSALTNILLTNLTFAVANAPIGSGQKDDFGSSYSAAIACTYTANCVIDNCLVYGVAGSGIGTDAWLNNFAIIVRNCIVHDVGSGGIVFHGGTACVISNNLVYSTGLLCQAGPGIRGSPRLSTLIIHNTVTNCSGAGIVVVTGTNSVVSYNYISRCVKALRDMGAIYVGQGAISNSILANYVGEVNGTNSDNGGVWDPLIFGIYFDKGTVNGYAASNITYNCTRPFIYHMATNGVYLNNFFINTRAEDTIISFHNADRTVVFQRNILFSQKRPFVDAENASYLPYSLDVNLAVADWRSNICWSALGLNANNPTNALTADPLFQNVQPLNAAFQPNSPADALGISRLRLNGIGLFSQGLTLQPTGLHVVTNSP
jgi:hypothetical protein